jgi:DNA-binding NarL/FixJ family response regulator
VIRSSSEAKRIALALPGRLFRDCIHQLVQTSDRVIVGSSENLDDMVAAYDAQDVPDVFIVGVRGAEQLAKIRSLRVALPSARWILLTGECDIGVVREALEIGVDGLLHEDSLAQVLKLVIELVLLGHSCIPVEFAKQVCGGPQRGDEGSLDQDEEHARRETAGFGRGHDATNTEVLHPRPQPRPRVEVIEFRRDPGENRPSGFRDTGRLSDREEQILECLAKGSPNKLIARELHIAEATVKVHVKALLRKMRVSNRTQAAIAAPDFLGASGRDGKTLGRSGLSDNIDVDLDRPRVEALGALRSGAARWAPTHQLPPGSDNSALAKSPSQ